MDVEETVTTLEPEVAEQEVTEEAIQEEETPNPETAEGQEEQEGDDDLEEVGIGGAKYRLPKEIAAAITGFNRDLTQKQQETAATRKEAEATLAEVQKEASLNRELFKEVAQLNSIESELEQFRNVNWQEEYARDPQQAGAWQARYTQLRDLHSNLTGHVEAKKSEIESSFASRKAKAIEKAVETLNKPDPDKGWSGKFDDATREGLAKFGKEIGFTDEELSNTDHPLMIKTLNLAKIGMEYLKQKKTAPARTPAEPAAKVPTSRASSPINARTASMEAYAAARKAGKIK